jgi:hypothetical protein
VAINCSTGAIVPAWASILVAIQVAPYAKKTVDGIEDLEASLYEELLAKVDYSVYANKAIIIKGCSKTSTHEGLCYSSTSSTSLCQKHNVW